MKKLFHAKRIKHILIAFTLIAATIFIPTANTYATISSAHGSYTNFVFYVRTDREPFIRMNTGDSWSGFSDFATEEFNEKYYIDNFTGINFSSSNTSIASIDGNGILHANSAGNTTITGEATILGSIRNVEIPVTVTDYTLTTDKTDIYLSPGSSADIAITTAASSVSATSADGITVAPTSGNNFTISAASTTAPGVYTATFTAIAEGGTITNVYKTVNVHVYGLLIESDQAGTTLRTGDQFNYTVDEDNTYGEIDAILKRDGETVTDTSTEGSYTITIFNASAAEHGINLAYTFAFNVIKQVEEETISVIAGNPLSSDTFATGSIWETDFATNTTTESDLPIINGTPEFDTNSEITTHQISLGHTFMSGKEILKNVTINIYKMVAPSETEYSGELTDGQFTTEIDVHDLNNAAIVTNNGEEIENLTVDRNTVTITATGEYTLIYTDKMADGTTVGTYTATFNVSEPQTSMGSDEPINENNNNVKATATIASPDTGKVSIKQQVKTTSAKYTASSTVILATFITLFGVTWFAKKREN